MSDDSRSIDDVCTLLGEEQNINIQIEVKKRRHSLSDIDLKNHKNCIKMNNISLANQVTYDVFPSLHLLYDFIDSNDAHNKALLKYPILPYSIIAFYVLLVTWIGPAIMKSHKPFNCRRV
ncbi:hypothetical protein TNCT_728521 [Trichonephila clavata]|uniref:Uncharacterized protein n=1 Tax=Trichonephila clavata TaxID=2740835 RepID=A0A8X6EXS1_TRICU|nr:hypothetical protein TNCT_728521 [Trichonephila clavata]